MILLTEYHANSIRLRRVLLLRSDIRLMPSDICFASLWANRISLKPQGFNITVAVRQYHSLRQQRISLYNNRKRGNFSAINRFVSSFCLYRGSPKRKYELWGFTYMGMGLAHLHLTGQMRRLHFCQSINSPLRTSPFGGDIFCFYARFCIFAFFFLSLFLLLFLSSALILSVTSPLSFLPIYLYRAARARSWLSPPLVF